MDSISSGLLLKNNNANNLISNANEALDFLAVNKSRKSMKSWRSDTNIADMIREEQVSYTLNNQNEYEDEIDSVLNDHKPIEFSDYNAVYDILNQSNLNSQLVDGEEESSEPNSLNHEKLFALNLIKNNYKLTYDYHNHNASAQTNRDLFELRENPIDNLNGSLLLNESLSTLYKNVLLEENGNLMDWSMKLSTNFLEQNRKPSSKASSKKSTSWGKLKHSKSSSTNLSKQMNESQTIKQSKRIIRINTKKCMKKETQYKRAKTKKRDSINKKQKKSMGLNT